MCIFGASSVGTCSEVVNCVRLRTIVSPILRLFLSTRTPQTQFRGGGERRMNFCHRNNLSTDRRLNARIVGSPGLDAVLNRFGLEVFGDRARNERGEFRVGGEAQRDELARRE